MGELAYHFNRAEDWSKAMEYSSLAGDQSTHSYANGEAIEHYARAIDAVSKLPPAASGAIADLHAKRGEVLSLVGKHQEALAEYASALDCARSANDRARQCRFMLGLGWAQYNAHQFEMVLGTCEQSRSLARELGDAAIQAASSVAIALARADCDGGTPEIIERADEAVHLAERPPEPHLLAQAKCVLGCALQWYGDFERSSDHLSKSLEIAREVHLGYFIGQNLFFLGHRSLSRGEYEDALGWYQQLSEYAETAGDAFWLSRTPNCKGAIPLELYDLDLALELQLQGEQAARKYSAWPEPLGHSLLKAGLVYVERTD